MHDAVGHALRRLYNSPAKKVWRAAPPSIRKLGMRVADRFAGYGMPFVEIPRVYLTLRCNLRCPYCSDGRAYDKSDMGYAPLPVDEWIEIINALPGDAVILTGGEPALYPGVADIVNGIRRPKVLLYTNLAYDVGKVLDRFTRPVTFFTSFHPNNPQVTLERSAAALRILRRHPMCADVASHHVIRHPSNGSDRELQTMRRMFAREGVRLLVYDDQNEVNAHGPDACAHGAQRLVECRARRVVIGPDGLRHFCVSKMVRQSRDRHVALDGAAPRRICAEFGLCSPCDEAAEIRPVPARATEVGLSRLDPAEAARASMSTQAVS